MRNQSAKDYSRFSVETKKVTIEKLNTLAKEKGISRNKLINIAIAEYFENHNNQ